MAGGSDGEQASLAIKTRTHLDMQCYTGAGATACAAYQNGGIELPTGANLTWDVNSNAVKANALDAGNNKVIKWLQPLSQTTYGTTLRRYSKDDYVKAWNLKV